MTLISDVIINYIMINDIIQGPAVSLADYTVIYTEMKRWLEEKIKQFKERKFRNDAKQVEVWCDIL